MAKVITDCSGTPANDAERKAIGFLRDHLPDSWLIFHNFEMRQGKEMFEIDLAILASHAVYLADVKGTRGQIDVYGNKWYPEGRQPFYSPREKLDKHAKTLAAIIRESNPGLIDLRKAHVHAVVLLTADDAHFVDHTGKDGPDVTDLKHCLKYFNDKSRIPEYRLDNILRFFGPIVNAITGKAKPQNSPLIFGHWQVEEKLGGTDHYSEYRAKHSFAGKSMGFARIRVYSIDPFRSEKERNEEYLKISNAYRAVAHMTVTPHPNLLPVKDLFDTEEKDKVILVTDDVQGQALRQHINKPNLALTFDQKLQVMRDILSALDHAHKYEVIHRNLTPDAVIITRSGQARVTAFDFARVGKNRTSTIADQIVEDLDKDYQAPECSHDPSQASIASDIYSAGIIFYQLLTGELPFENIDHMMEADGKFPVKPSEHKPELPAGFDKWLQEFCEFDPEDRYPSAAVALNALEEIIRPGPQNIPPGDKDVPATPVELLDLTELQCNDVLTERFLIKEKLGSGQFSVVYKVFDLMCDTNRVLKLVIKDRLSVYERLRQEYTILQQTETRPHPNVVKVIWADRLNDKERTPYILFEYIDGFNISELIEVKGLSVDEAATIAQQAAEGLKYLHELEIYHQDIKPQNLILTDHGVKIIDFNVASSEKKEVQSAGGTRRYLPPDYDTSVEPSPQERIDRDIYALGITFYECLSGQYPFEEPEPTLKKLPRDLKHFGGCSDLSSPLLRVVYKMIAPMRKDRYASTSAFLEDFAQLKGKYRSLFSTSELNAVPKSLVKGFLPDGPNVNPFVGYLLTLYSQSSSSNAGTRGLDDVGKGTYIPTYLDEKLMPALLKGEFRLVVISGNAGDGKTAFIQQLEAFAVSKGAQIQGGANGAVFQLKGHTFRSNYDGSQDEGDQRNDDVLREFFATFKGDDANKWSTNQTRIIAINEGRLVDFFLQYERDFPLLFEAIHKGLSGQAHIDGILVINLNLRSVVADLQDGKGSILERLILRMTQPEYWQACANCDLEKKCYVYHNARTFQDPKAGPKVLERLKLLYTITHFRGRLHITMRDLRSALSYMLAGTLDCKGIHGLYYNSSEENLDRILDGFYFNSWLGGSAGSNDRLVSLLREIDMARVSNPALDRGFAFLKPGFKKMNRFSFPDRQEYDERLLEKLFENLPRDFSSNSRNYHIDRHRNYLSYIRRKHFFECRDTSWQEMLPYSSVNEFMKIVRNPGERGANNIKNIIQAINRGEGLSEPGGLGNQLALRVRKVTRGTIRSYRLFNGAKFSLDIETGSDSHPFIECLPQHLLLYYNQADGQAASLVLNIDVFEMLMRLNNGYKPNVEEEEGFYLSLSVFKNILSAAPYQEVLLTENGFEFYRIRRDDKGVLHLDEVGWRNG